MPKSYEKIVNKNCPINKPIFFFVLNEFLDFSEYIWMTSEFFYQFENTSFELGT